ncbi:MAG: ferritin [Flavobacteriales bacterium]|nr:ferritin [Flavobacteriales bacterium]
MLNKKVEKALNDQIKVESDSSQAYLAMACWAEIQGFSGTAAFLYRHSDEERMHMLKLVHFVNDRGGQAIIPELKQPTRSYKSLHAIFQALHDHEVKVTAEINSVVDICLKEKDYTTHNFMQWYVSEQIEEETLARNILDKLRLIGEDKGGLYIFDRDLESLNTTMKKEGGA